jgi:hypothetical protein
MQIYIPDTLWQSVRVSTVITFKGLHTDFNMRF